MTAPDYRERAREINVAMDIWLRAQRAAGTWAMHASTTGQEFYADLVSQALAEAWREGRRAGLGEAARMTDLHASTLTFTELATRIRALVKEEK